MNRDVVLRIQQVFVRKLSLKANRGCVVRQHLLLYYGIWLLVLVSMVGRILLEWLVVPLVLLLCLVLLPLGLLYPVGPRCIDMGGLALSVV